MNKLSLDIPDKLIPFLQCRKMYQVLYGGRSSAKTYTALLKLITRALEKSNQTILCTREFQSSIATSTYAELKQIIYARNLEKLFDIKHDKIVCYNGTQFIFKGLARDIMQIKSIPNIDICFVEEAETIGAELWDVLNPTLRKEGCELIILFNPRESTSATYQRWVTDKIKDEYILRIEINYDENPFNSALMLAKIQEMKENNYALYEHIYLGKVLDMSEDVIFKGRFKILDLGLQEKDGLWYRNVDRRERFYFLYGMDFGFSTDPVAMIEVGFWDDNTIYVHNEHYEHNLIPNNYIDKMKQIFGNQPSFFKWWGDEARPDTIAQLKWYGLNMEGAPKGKGSVEAGIQYLLGKNIVVHPRCKNFIYECYNYRYKKDKNTGIITTDIIDANNHGWDAIRYALCEQISVNNRKPLRIDPRIKQQLGIY